MGDHLSDYGILNELVWVGRNQHGLHSLARRATTVGGEGGVGVFLSVATGRNSMARDFVTAQCRYRPSHRDLESARSRAPRCWRVGTVAART